VRSPLLVAKAVWLLVYMMDLIGEKNQLSESVVEYILHNSKEVSAGKL
jgi:hypothetical protein